MAALIYTQVEADAMLAMEKRIELDAWTNRKTGRPPDQDSTIVIDASAESGDSRFAFKIEMARNDRNETFAISLKGKIAGRPWDGLCRYEIQNNEHENDLRCCDAAIVEPGTFHRHVYNERSYEILERWDGCAERLDLSTDGTFEEQATRLRWRFLNDMRLRFSDSQTVEGLFGKDF